MARAPVAGTPDRRILLWQAFSPLPVIMLVIMKGSGRTCPSGFMIRRSGPTQVRGRPLLGHPPRVPHPGTRLSRLGHPFGAAAPFESSVTARKLRAEGPRWP